MLEIKCPQMISILKKTQLGITKAITNVRPLFLTYMVIFRHLCNSTVTFFDRMRFLGFSPKPFISPSFPSDPCYTL